MSGYHYPASSLLTDHVRAGIGLIATAGPLLFLDLLSALTCILAPLAVLFALFATRTLIRQFTTFELSDASLKASGPLGNEVPWSDLKDVELRYYSTRRDRRRGWMQLRIKGRKRAIRLDSTLRGFSDIVARAAKEADQHGITLSDSTLENMRAMGIAGLT